MCANIREKKLSSEGYSLLEVMAMSVLLASFLIGFYYGSMRMSSSMLVQQDRNEALLQSRRIGEGWRAGVTVSGITKGYYLNGVAYTVSMANTQSSVSTLKKMALTLSWNEPDPDSSGSNPAPRNMHIKDVYLKY